MLLRLLLSCLCLQASLSGIRTAASLAALQFNGGATQVGLLLSSISFFPMFLSIPVGQWIDVKGARTPILLACLFFVFGCAIVTWAPHSWNVVPLYVACIFGGICCAQ